MKMWMQFNVMPWTSRGVDVVLRSHPVYKYVPKNSCHAH